MEIGVHTGRMGSDVRNLESLVSAMKRDAERIKDSMDRLNSMWTGSANQAMRQRFETDYRNVTALCRVCELMAEDMEQMRREYESCEYRVSAQVSF